MWGSALRLSFPLEGLTPGLQQCFALEQRFGCGIGVDFPLLHLLEGCGELFIPAYECQYPIADGPLHYLQKLCPALRLAPKVQLPSFL